jgi:hypothetical protein
VGDSEYQDDMDSEMAMANGGRSRTLPARPGSSCLSFLFNHYVAYILLLTAMLMEMLIHME